MSKKAILRSLTSYVPIIIEEVTYSFADLTLGAPDSYE